MDFFVLRILPWLAGAFIAAGIIVVALSVVRRSRTMTFIGAGLVVAFVLSVAAMALYAFARL